MTGTYTKRDWEKLCGTASDTRDWDHSSGDDRIELTDRNGDYRVWIEEMSPGRYQVFCLNDAARRALGRLEMAALGRYIWGIE